MKSEEEKKSKLRECRCKDCGEPVDEINTLCEECIDEFYWMLAMY